MVLHYTNIRIRMSVTASGEAEFHAFKRRSASFLQSAAGYWLAEYHFDGLRMDAVSNLIYWQGNEARGVDNLAVSFIQNMNQGLKTVFRQRCWWQRILLRSGSDKNGV